MRLVCCGLGCCRGRRAGSRGRRLAGGRSTGLRRAAEVRTCWRTWPASAVAWKTPSRPIGALGERLRIVLEGVRRRLRAFVDDGQHAADCSLGRVALKLVQNERDVGPFCSMVRVGQSLPRADCSCRPCRPSCRARRW